MSFFKTLTVLKDRAPSPQLTADRRAKRTADELIGICRGVLADGHVSQQEAEFVRDWLNRNAEFCDSYPFRNMLERLHDALRDGVIDQDEEHDLLEMVIKFVGGEARGQYDSESVSRSSVLPLDDPPPSEILHASPFVVTGAFTFGPRDEIVRTIEAHGGTVNTGVSKKVRYLVVGELASRDWLHSNMGTKILKAVELRENGAKIALISERIWANSLRPI